MAEYGKITRDLQDTGERREYTEAPLDKDVIGADKPYWVPVVKERINNSTGSFIKRVQDKIIETDRIVYRETIEDLTVEEMNAEDSTTIERSFRIGSPERALATALFQLANDVRELKGQQPITVPEFKAFLKTLLR